VQKEIKKQVTKTRWPAEVINTVDLLTEKMEQISQPLVRVETLPIAMHMTMDEVLEEIPEGHIVASDPVVL
jgi:hypothetical protein